jgi:hypothetical protein
MNSYGFTQLFHILSPDLKHNKSVCFSLDAVSNIRKSQFESKSKKGK